VGAVAQLAEPGDVVGMQMGVDRLDQLEIELAQQLAVAIDLLQHGVENQGLAAGAAGQQITVGSGDAVEQLAKDHDGWLPFSCGIIIDFGLSRRVRIAR
jgi:hypothetical protein